MSEWNEQDQYSANLQGWAVRGEGRNCHIGSFRFDDEPEADRRFGSDEEADEWVRDRVARHLLHKRAIQFVGDEQNGVNVQLSQAKRLYEDFMKEAEKTIHSNRIPSWHELSPSAQRAYFDRAVDQERASHIHTVLDELGVEAGATVEGRVRAALAGR